MIRTIKNLNDVFFKSALIALLIFPLAGCDSDELV
jgi:hypothetical protein